MMDINFDEMYEGLKRTLEVNGHGKEADYTGFTPHLISHELRQHLYYKDVSIFVNEGDGVFMFVKNDKILYLGNIDQEGTEQTIIHEITAFKYLINTYMVLANDDPQGLIALRMEPNFDHLFLATFQQAYQKGIDNEHYTKEDLFPQEPIN